MIRTKFQTPAKSETIPVFSDRECIPLNLCGIGFCDFEKSVLGLLRRPYGPEKNRLSAAGFNMDLTRKH